MSFDIDVCQYRNPLCLDGPFLIEFEAPFYMASPRLKSSQVLTLSYLLLIQLRMLCHLPIPIFKTSIFLPQSRSEITSSRYPDYLRFLTIFDYYFKVETPSVPSLLPDSHLHWTKLHPKLSRLAHFPESRNGR